jgi:hypothetical protein
MGNLEGVCKGDWNHPSTVEALVATLAQARLPTPFAHPASASPRASPHEVVGAAMLELVARVKGNFASAVPLAQLLPALQPPPPPVVLAVSPFKRKQPYDSNADAADGAKRRLPEGLREHSNQLSSQVPLT